MSSTGIIVCQAAGTSLADPDGLAASQSIAAGGAMTLNGSLTTGGTWSNAGWGYKVTAVSAGDDSNKLLVVAGKFYASNSAGNFSSACTITMANAGTATSALYAVEVTGATIGSASAGAVTLGLAADGSGVPVGLPFGSLYQCNYGGTFGGGTIQIKKYNSLNSEWLPFGTETGETAATVKNYELPSATTLKAFLTSGSTTTAIGVDFEIISKQK